MELVIVESPFAAGFLHTEAEHIAYARQCMKDCLTRGEAPYASHLLYTQEGVLDDTIPEEREHGIQAGFAWRQVATKTVVYEDLGISKGMQYGIDDANKRGILVVYRKILYSDKTTSERVST